MLNLKLFINGHKGFETLLFHELRDILHATDSQLKKVYGGVEINAEIEAVYLICLHSRLANRVFCELARAEAEHEAQLYQAVFQIDWDTHLSARDSIAVSATVSRSRLNHGHFVALKAKDAIVDQFRETCGSRPRVEKNQPDLQIHINIHRNQASISLDLSGQSLHRRGYRREHSGAPLKEHLAAALLLQAGWNYQSASQQRLLDPMCGSGTFAIEAAMIGANIAPGIGREYFGFNQWRRHDADLWQDCVRQAREAIVTPETVIFASDFDAYALKIARANAERAQVQNLIKFSHQQISDLRLPTTPLPTLVIANPPYGQRLQSESGLGQLYSDLGECLSRLAPAKLALISANPDWLHRLRLTRVCRKTVKNGPLECVFAVFETANETKDSVVKEFDGAIDDEIALPLQNRLIKNSKHLQRWANKNGISCYRLYDADLPEFSFALDRFQSEIAPEIEWFHLQEYEAPKTIDRSVAAHRIAVAQAVVKKLFAIPEQRLFCKIRSRQRGPQQYQKQDNQQEYFQVREGEASLLINLSDYLDAGLFLDHRITREMVYHHAADKSVLNLFCYTGTIGVQAGLGGASSVLNVDMSATYLKWAEENHTLNRLKDESRYQFLRADVIELLKDPTRFSLKQNYDLIFFDPPSFSNSSKMQQTLDIQRDHEKLISAAMRLLAENGLLLFSSNRRGFTLADGIADQFEVRDITRATIAEDFKRSPRIHSCWEIRHQR